MRYAIILALLVACTSCHDQHREKSEKKLDFSPPKSLSSHPIMPESEADKKLDKELDQKIDQKFHDYFSDFVLPQMLPAPPKPFEVCHNSDKEMLSMFKAYASRALPDGYTCIAMYDYGNNVLHLSYYSLRVDPKKCVQIFNDQFQVVLLCGLPMYRL